MVNWRENGRGEALTLLHGISSQAASWHKQLAGSDEWRVLAWDMPGYGVSAPLLNDRPDADDYARALATMLDSAGVERTVLVGHSLGAMVACAFAARYPHRVCRLILVDPAQGYGPTGREQRQKIWEERNHQLTQGFDWMADHRATRLLRPGARKADIDAVAHSMRQLNDRGYLAAAWMLAHGDIQRYLAQWSGPFEVWCGERDVITPPEKSRALAQKWGMPYYAIPNAGHASYLDNEIFFNQQLLRVMKEASDERTN